jgi:hypothetical protein
MEDEQNEEVMPLSLPPPTAPTPADPALSGVQGAGEGVGAGNGTSTGRPQEHEAASEEERIITAIAAAGAAVSRPYIAAGAPSPARGQTAGSSSHKRAPSGVCADQSPSRQEAQREAEGAGLQSAGVAQSDAASRPGGGAATTATATAAGGAPASKRRRFIAIVDSLSSSDAK